MPLPDMQKVKAAVERHRLNDYIESNMRKSLHSDMTPVDAGRRKTFKPLPDNGYGFGSHRNRIGNLL